MKNIIWDSLTNLTTNPFQTFSDIPFVTFSHLRWEFVVQRPQHIMTRLAKTHPLLFIEEPVTPPEGNGAEFIVKHPQPNITVLVPYTSGISYENTVSGFI